MMKKFVMVFIFSSLIVLSSIFLVFPSKSEAGIDCLKLSNLSSEADRAYCRNELVQIEAQLASLLKQQSEQKKQSGTLQGDVTYLNSQINALKTKIKARSLKIAELKVDINNKVKTIGTLSEKIDREHESLAR